MMREELVITCSFLQLCCWCGRSRQCEYLKKRAAWFAEQIFTEWYPTASAREQGWQARSSVFTGFDWSNVRHVFTLWWELSQAIFQNKANFGECWDDTKYHLFLFASLFWYWKWHYALQGTQVNHWQRSLLLHDLMQEFHKHWFSYWLAYKAFQIKELSGFSVLFWFCVL
jgi:hypothetical protein